jgi:DNA-binding transcriptional MerR regulator/methylmalonyl-CoA mutase cobalamin-binding subunit
MGLHEDEMPTALIGDVARETGLSKDTLRVWERRYGFPKPARNANEERVYSSEQIERLRVIRRLLDSGLRPGKIVGLPLHELNSFRAPVRAAASADADKLCAPQQLLALIKSHRADELHQCLVQQLMQLGLRHFILEVVVPLNGLVGNAWLMGCLEIFEEHLYAQQVQSLLQHALAAMPPSNLAPRVLLTTLPGEEHQLGILMAHAFFAMDGAHCVSLGTQTPPADILRAAAAYRVDIVGLSCSDANLSRVTNSQLSLLREGLDPAVELWVGGAFALPDRHKLAGVRPVTDLRELPIALAQWRTRVPCR